MYELTKEEIIKVKDFFNVRFNEIEKNKQDFFDLINQNYVTTLSNHSLDEIYYLQSLQKWIENQSKDVEEKADINLTYWLQTFCLQIFKTEGVRKKLALAKAKILFKLGLEVLGFKQKELIEVAFITRQMFTYIMGHKITVFL